MQQAAAPVRFDFATRRNRLQLSDLTFNAQNQTLRLDIPQVGYLAALKIYTFGTITPPGVGDNWGQYWPFNLYSNIVLRSNEGLEIYRTGGYTNMIVQQLWRNGLFTAMSRGFSSYAEPAVFSRNLYTTNQGMKTAFTHPLPGVATAAAATPVGVMHYIPVAIDAYLQAGLLLMQSQATRAQLELTTGSFNSFVQDNAAAAGFAMALTARVQMEFFSVPPQPEAQPDISYVHRIIEETSPWTAAGAFQYRIPVGGVVYRVVQDYQDGLVFGGAGGNPTADLYTTAADPNTARVTQTRVVYGGSQAPEIQSGQHHLINQRIVVGDDLPDGCLLWEFGHVETDLSRAYMRDSYNTAELTEFLLESTWSTAPAASSVCRSTRFELQLVGR